MILRNSPGAQVVVIKFLILAFIGSVSLMATVYLLVGGGSPGLQYGLVAAFWAALAKYSINEAYNKGLQATEE